MKNKIIFKWAGMLTILFLLMQTALQAGLYLPKSELWQGGSNFDKNGIKAFVEYAVYDSSQGLPSGISKPGSGKYVYAYQIFNLGKDLDPIMTFELIGNPAAASGIGSQSDSKGGLMPDNDGDEFIWRFTNGAFIAYEHSAFLVFSSNSAPVAGSFDIRNTLSNYGDDPPTNDNTVSELPDMHTPEPATVTMLTIGALTILKRRRSY